MFKKIARISTFFSYIIFLSNKIIFRSISNSILNISTKLFFLCIQVHSSLDLCRTFFYAVKIPTQNLSVYFHYYCLYVKLQIC